MKTLNSPDAYERKAFFDQWVDGQYQDDPLAGGRSGFTVFETEYGSREHIGISVYIRENMPPGMVTSSRTEFRGYRKRHWTRGPVTFEFEHRGCLLLALLEARRPQ